MSKLWRNVLIAVLVLALLGGALAFLLTTEPEKPSDNGETTDTTDTVDESVTLIDIKVPEKGASPITSVKVTSKGFDSFTVEQNKEGALFVKGFEGLGPNTALFEALESLLTKLKATKKVTETDEPAAFGFDQPAATFAVTYDDGKSYTLEFGNEEPYGTGDYFRFADSNTVYLVDTYLLDSVALNPSAYISTTLYSDPTLPTAGKNETVTAVLRDIAFTGSFYPQPFALRMVGSKDKSEYLYTNYLITEPYVCASNSDKLGDTIITAASLYADLAVVPRYTKKDLEKYGLSDPYIKAELHTAAHISAPSENEDDVMGNISFKNVEAHTVTLSKPDKDGNCYVIVDDNPSIFRINGGSIPWLELTYENSVSPLLFLKNISTLDRLTITVEGNTTAFQAAHYPEKEDADDQLAVTANGKKVSTEQFRSFYQVLMGISRQGATDKTPSGKPEVQVLVEGEGTDYDIKMYPVSASVYLVENQGELYKTTASQVRTLKKQLQNLLDGKEVNTNT